MRSGLALVLLMLTALLTFTACTARGKPAPGPEVPRPDSVLDPVVLYRENCAGCHGAEGKNGAAMSLSDPVYLAIVDDNTLRNTISKGRAGTAMSAFAQKEGGMLTDQQIDAIIHGIRQRWSQPNVLSGVAAPPYAAKVPGNAQAGQAVYTTFCASCHGTDNQGGLKAGSVTNGAYLSLISDQGLRTIVITGRPDFNAPDWRNNVAGHPMSDQEITDVVTWLAAQRPNLSSQPATANTISTSSATIANPSSPGGAH
jgi:mono/diheme cytochrome c family protein